MKIGDKYSGKSGTQNYGDKPQIQGVHLIELKRFTDCGGSFSEILRIIDGKVGDFEIKQINYSEMMPTVVKAGHYHLEQDDLWFVPAASRVLIGLKDLREDSPSFEVVSRFVMGDGKAQLLFIPHGVLHGVANLWDKPASLIYFVNKNFDSKNPDEYRLPPEEFGNDFWVIKKE